MGFNEKDFFYGFASFLLCTFIKRVATSTSFSPWWGSAKDAGLLAQLLFRENLHRIVGVVFLIVCQLYPPIAAHT